MTETIPHLSLAAINMAVQSPDVRDLDAFGLKVLQGCDHTPSYANGSISEQELNLFITNLLEKSKWMDKQVAIIPLSRTLEGKITRLGDTQSFNILLLRNFHLQAAWRAAHEWLNEKPGSAVILIEENVEHQFLSAMMLMAETEAEQKGLIIYTVMDCAGISTIKDPLQTLSEEIQSLLISNATESHQIGLAITSHSLEKALNKPITQALIPALKTTHGRTCALAGGQGELYALIKAAWCVHNRVIPGTNDWKSPDQGQLLQQSSLYIPTESRTWLTSTNAPNRQAIAIISDNQDVNSLILLRELKDSKNPVISIFNQAASLLFPFSGTAPDEIINKLLVFSQEVESQANLKALSTQRIKLFNNTRPSENYRICIIGENPQDILREVNFAVKGIPAAVNRNTDWRTPKGSYFSPAPLGETGTVSFVYPGAFNAYPGIAREIFFHFPELLNRLECLSKNTSDLLKEELLYPRRVFPLSAADNQEAERKLTEDPIAMLVSGICLSTIYTLLLREIFNLQPKSAFGYSLGEISMLFANGVWHQVDEASAAIHASPLFKTRLAGPQNTIREKWNFPIAQSGMRNSPIWRNHVLMASPEVVNQHIQHEQRVFLTHINTSKQTVIGGNPQACEKLIAVLGCNSLQAPFSEVLHCEAMQSEYWPLKNLLDWKVFENPQMKFFASASHQSLPMNREMIAEQIATGLCRQLDFPRLVNMAYSDGARVFIEVGAGANCTRWIDEILQDKPHVALAVNRKGLGDHAAICQFISKLICHHIPVNLASFT